MLRTLSIVHGQLLCNYKGRALAPSNYCLTSFFVYNSFPQEDGPVVTVVDTLLEMLDEDVVDNSKSCAEYLSSSGLC